MSVARVTEITSSSKVSFQDALEKGVERANKTLKNVRGAWVQEYPYPILNAIELGYPQVLLNAVYMTAGLGVLTLIVIAVDGLLGRATARLA